MLTLTVGHTYRAKRPANSGGRVNDRTIVWKSQDGSLVQYDGPAVRNVYLFYQGITSCYRKNLVEEAA